MSYLKYDMAYIHDDDEIEIKVKNFFCCSTEINSFRFFKNLYSFNTGMKLVLIMAVILTLYTNSNLKL